MADIVKDILAKPIQLADQVAKTAGEASSGKQDCLELKSKAEKLAALLRNAARASSDLYKRPTVRIIDDTEQVLNKALALVQKCNSHGLVKRIFTIVPSTSFRKMSANLENSIGDVTWLLHVSAAAAGGGGYVGLPPIAANEPILCLIWAQIASLYTGSLDDRSDAAASLVSLARDNDRYGKLIIEEDGVGPLLKLVKDGKPEGQENAARAIGLLGRDTESVEHMLELGVCQVFAKILKEGPMKVQAVVAWAVSELAAHYPKCQDIFGQHNVIRLLVVHLAFETVEEHSKYAITSNKATLIQAVEITSGSSKTGNNVSKGNEDADKKNQSQIPHPLGKKQSNHMHNVVTSTMAIKGQLKPPQWHNNGANETNHVKSNISNNATQNHHHQQNVLLSSGKGRELEEPATKAYMKAMAARALSCLAKGNSAICRSICESRALLCFAVLLEKGSKDVQYHSAMALMEIAAVAEHDTELRRSAFKPNSPVCKAIIEQLLKVVEKADSELLISCIRTIGNLARTFQATETRIIKPLVQLLDEREAEISKEACITLTKFASTDNYLHLDHAKAIIAADGAKHLVQLVYFGEQQIVQRSALVLLSYIALHVSDSEELARAEVLVVLVWASKQAFLVHDEKVETLLHEAKGRLEVFQSRGSRGFH
ncbi:uncharacterized protein LOC132266592 [Cornus florida]|uniref:uncharacterized protein LOC132266592 n=1 Tax=Cornus florida TaxID=4283 RepID=UPI00289F3AB7|nr:uncharacterized protein LOC132266592 [Cornus florida]